MFAVFSHLKHLRMIFCFKDRNMKESNILYKQTTNLFVKSPVGQ